MAEKRIVEICAHGSATRGKIGVSMETLKVMTGHPISRQNENKHPIAGEQLSPS